MTRRAAGLLLLLLCSLLNGCALLSITATVVGVAGTVVSTGVKTTGAIVAGPFKLVGGNDDDEKKDKAPPDEDEK